MAKSRYSLKNFLKELGIPPAEHDAVAESVDRARAAAERDGWGSDGAPVLPNDLFRVPHLLGYAAVAVVRHAALSPGTKLKIVRFTLQQARPLKDNGTPRGLTVLLSFLAGAGALDLAGFTAAMKLAEIERAIFDELKLDELRALTDWLLAQPELDDRQRLWWLWFLAGHCQQPTLGRPWIDYLLEHRGLADDFKHALCAAWLSDRSPSLAPEPWRALDQALAAEMRLDQAAPDPAADLDGPLLSMQEDGEDDEAEAEDDVFASLNVVGHLMRSALGGYLLMPPYIQRRAVLGLAQTGDDARVLCQRYLDTDRRDDTGTLTQAVADVLRAYHGQMPPDAVQALIERGLSLPQVNTRKAFYALAAHLDGPAVWQRARHDNTASVRAWAAKQDAGRPGRKA